MRYKSHFNLEDQAVNGMRDFLEHPHSLAPLIRCMQTIPCSTAECLRGFSLMNNICTDKRSTLLLSNVSNFMMMSINGPPLGHLYHFLSQEVCYNMAEEPSLCHTKRQCTPQVQTYLDPLFFFFQDLWSNTVGLIHET